MTERGLLIVDSNPIYREALMEKLALDFSRPLVQIVDAGCAQEALDILCNSHLLWVVMLEIQMAGLSGLASIRAFHAQPQVMHVVCLSSLNAKLWEPRTIRAGASLFLSKDSSSATICRQLNRLMCMDPTKEGAPAAPDARPAFQLTSQQRDVLNLIAQGHANHTIAGLLEINEPTVKIHIHQIFKALRVFNRTQAIHRAQKSNLI